MFGYSFSYCGKSLEDYHMMLANPDNDTLQYPSREISKGTITQRRPKPKHYGVAYSDVMSFNLLAIRAPEDNSKQEELQFANEELDELMDWLEYPKTPQWLEVVQESETAYYRGLFTSVQPFVFGTDCYGLTLTFTCDAPFRYSDEMKFEQSLDNSAVETYGTFYTPSGHSTPMLPPTITLSIDSSRSSSNTWFGITVGDSVVKGEHFGMMVPYDKKSVVVDCENKLIYAIDASGKRSMISIADAGYKVTDDEIKFVWPTIHSGENHIIFSRSIDDNPFGGTSSKSNLVSKITISTRCLLRSGGF